MKMSGSLVVKVTVGSPAVFCRSESLKPLHDDSRRLPVVVGVHLDIRRADVHLVTASLQHTTRVFITQNMHKDKFIVTTPVRTLTEKWAKDLFIPLCDT